MSLNFFEYGFTKEGLGEHKATERKHTLIPLTAALCSPVLCDVAAAMWLSLSHSKEALFALICCDNGSL